MFDLMDLRSSDSPVARLLGYVPNIADGVFDVVAEPPPGRWSGAEPSPESAAGLARAAAHPAGLSDTQVVDAIVAAERLQAWARAQQVVSWPSSPAAAPGTTPSPARAPPTRAPGGPRTRSGWR